MKIAFFRPNSPPSDTICTRGNPSKGGNYPQEIKGIVALDGIPLFSTILVHPLKKKGYNFPNKYR
jgi:hypothetical protein